MADHQRMNASGKASTLPQLLPMTTMPSPSSISEIRNKEVSSMAVDAFDVLAKCRMGLAPAEIAKLLDCGEKHVQKIIDDATARGVIGPKKTTSSAKLTHEAREQLRKRIADYVAGGKSTTEAATKFSVKENYVVRACKEHDIDVPRKTGSGSKTPKVSQLEIIAKILENPGVTEATIAEMLEVTPQYVNLARTKANRAGLILAIEKVKRTAVEEDRKAREKK